MNINESTRHRREYGEDFNHVDDLMSIYFSSSAKDKLTYIRNFAFTMTNIDKVGINPNTNYNTPAGVYAYILDRETLNQLLTNKLPFVSDNKFCSILKINKEKKWLIVGPDYVDGNTSDEELKNIINLVGKDVYEQAQEEGKHWENFNNDSKVFDLTYFATKTSSRPTIKWTSLLRKLGYSGVYDKEYGILHPSEPTSIVFFEPNSYSVIRTYRTKDLRKDKEDNNSDNNEFSSKIVDSLMAFKTEQDILLFLQSLNIDKIDINNYEWNDNKREDILDLFYQILSGKTRIRPDLMTEKVLLEAIKTNTRLIKNNSNNKEKQKRIYFDSLRLLIQNQFITDRLNKIILKILLKSIDYFGDEIIGSFGLDKNNFLLRIMAEKNSSITMETINEIKKQFDGLEANIDEYLLNNENIPKEFLEDWIDKSNIKKSIKFFKEPIEQLFLIAKNKNTPTDFITLLFEYYRNNIKMLGFLIQNPNLPKEIYDQILNIFLGLFDKDDHISKYNDIKIADLIRFFPHIQERYSLEIYKKSNNEIKKIILRYGNISSSVIHFIAKKLCDNISRIKDMEIYNLEYLMDNKNCSLKTLRYIRDFELNSIGYLSERANKIIQDRIKDKFGINQNLNFMGFGMRRN